MSVFARLSSVAAALAACASGAFADAPERVVSMNLCTDQLALMIGAPGQVISVSTVAVDPLSSVVAEEASGLPLNAGRAEEIYAMAPDLVLAADWSDPFAVALLRDLGVEVAQVASVSSLDAIAPTVREMGRLLGREAVAEAMAAEVEARLTELVPVAADAPVAAIYYPSGYSLGAGTLTHEIVTAAGFRNMGAEAGLAGGGTLALETLLMDPPDLLVTTPSYAGASRAEAVMSHPALAALPRVESGAAWGCGTPAVLDAIDALRAAREALD